MNNSLGNRLIQFSLLFSPVLAALENRGKFLFSSYLCLPPTLIGKLALCAFVCLLCFGLGLTHFLVLSEMD